MKSIKLTIVVGVVLLFPISSVGLSLSEISQSDALQNIKDDDIVVLVTGFGPFGSYDINPSQLIAEELDGEVIAGATVYGIVLPVDFTDSVEEAVQAIENVNPDIIISLGLAARTRWIQVEKIGLNLRRKYENIIFILQRLDPNGPIIRISSIPTYCITKEIRNEGIPVRQSLHAGIYICNALLYGVLGHITENNLPIRAGFIHVPLMISQNPVGGMHLEDMINATRIAIQVSVNC